jgi:hypothetical protein
LRPPDLKVGLCPLSLEPWPLKSIGLTLAANLKRSSS